jgi:hypothetical protein
MTLPQGLFVFAVLVACCVAMVWMSKDARPYKTPDAADKLNDREQNLEMLAQVKDRFSLAVYKRAYNIEDSELQKKKVEAGVGD